LLQPKLNLKVSQRQVLTPGLVQMVSVLALNKLELKEMINTEMVENPVLEEVEESTVTIEEMAGREGDRERSAEEVATAGERVEKDPFDEIDFGSYFQDYLDPGFRTGSSFEEIDRPSFDNFLSQPSTLTDHLVWQLGSMNLSSRVRLAADLVVGNLNEDGYLTASDEELAEALLQMRGPARAEPIPFERGMKNKPGGREAHFLTGHGIVELAAAAASVDVSTAVSNGAGVAAGLAASNGAGTAAGNGDGGVHAGLHEERAAALATVVQAREIVNHLDPVGVAARDLRECLTIQIAAHRREAEMVLKRADARKIQDAADLAEEFDGDGSQNGNGQYAAAVELRNGAGSSEAQVRVSGSGDVFEIAAHIVANHLALLQKKDMRELTRSCGRGVEEVQAAVDFIRTLDPRPGQRYNLSETRLIEPDVAFVKRDGEYVVLMNEEDMPTLRLSRGYRKMLREKQTEKDVREYVKERYKSAIQLLRNIEQRKNTIVRTCEVIVRRQQDFLERGEQGLRPMMIKEVAEEIGVHPSTVSRAVANKYVHTSQGVYELRYFFTEGVNGPEGGDLPLVLLKRKVKKLIEDEDPRKPLTDDQLAAELQRQGIRVTRRTVAKYREDMQIPSTHQRRVR
jgi:RNA polymerase sigma-54 factor